MTRAKVSCLTHSARQGPLGPLKGLKRSVGESQYLKGRGPQWEKNNSVEILDGEGLGFGSPGPFPRPLLGLEFLWFVSRDGSSPCVAPAGTLLVEY